MIYTWRELEDAIMKCTKNAELKKNEDEGKRDVERRSREMRVRFVRHILQNENLSSFREMSLG